MTISSLVYKGKVLGYRVLDKGVCYDIPLDAIKLPTIFEGGIPKIPLIEQGNLLVTEEELHGGLTTKNLDISTQRDNELLIIRAMLSFYGEPSGVMVRAKKSMYEAMLKQRS